MGDWTCGTCRFWGDADDARRKFRKCQGVKHSSETSGSREGSRQTPAYYDDVTRKTVVITSSAHVVDGSGYYAALKCREDFGCVLWKAKP